MSIRSLKDLLFSLTDFEFLVSINSVDFVKKKIDIRPQFFNRLIGVIKTHVEITSKQQTIILVNNIKEIYLQRLALVSTHSFFRYFFKNIKIVFQSFSRRLNRYFEEKQFSASTGPSTLKKKSRKRSKKTNNIEITPTLPAPTVTEELESESETMERLNRFGLPYHGQPPPLDESESESSNSEIDEIEKESQTEEEDTEDSESTTDDINRAIDSDSTNDESRDSSDDEFTISGMGESSYSIN